MGRVAPFTEAFSAVAVMDRDVLTVEIRGELDVATTPDLEQTLDPHRGKYQRIRYDLDDLAFIDCFGLRGILAPIDRGDRDGRITITTNSRPVRRLLELLEMEELLAS